MKKKCVLYLQFVVVVVVSFARSLRWHEGFL